jgi:hypothetical protein
LRPDELKRSRLAFGVAPVCSVFLLETVFAHQKMHSTASPYVWGGLGSVALLAAAYGLWCRQRARRAPDDES